MTDTDESLLRIAQVNDLNRPSAFNHRALNEWLVRPECGDNFLRILEAEPWEHKNMPDLMALRHAGDHLDQWLARKLTPVWHSLIGRHAVPDTDPELGIGRLWEYKQNTFTVFGNICSMLLSSLVPLVSIFALFFVNEALPRLLMIGAFIMIFSGIMMFVVRCRRFEVFAATAAFAAVEVVFLQGVNVFRKA